jgi:hypothetical protein
MYLNRVINAFIWGFGKRLGSTAARKTSFLAIPALLLVGYLILNQLGIVSIDTGGLGVHALLEAFR